MNLDDIRRLSVAERAVADAAPKGPWKQGDILREGGCSVSLEHEVRAPYDTRIGECVLLSSNQHITGHEAAAKLAARSRTAVPALCDAVDALFAVVNALPKCECGATATVHVAHTGAVKCDWHAEVWTIFSPTDLPYSEALRVLLAKEQPR
jgi:hypothetical protein